jgi:hypothetical protein
VSGNSGTSVKLVFLANRLQYSRAIGVRGRALMDLDLETLARTMFEIVEGWGRVPGPECSTT